MKPIRLTLEEQKQLMGTAWRGHPRYVPTKAHLHPSSYTMEQVRKNAACQGRYGIY